MDKDNGKKLNKRSRKAVALVIDVIIAVVLNFIFVIAIFYLFGKQTAAIVEGPFGLLYIFIYFRLVPQMAGNTIGRKLLGIEDRFNLFWSPWIKESDDEFPQKALSVGKELKVIVRDGKWICPSCNEPSLEIYNACGNCGQEIEKVYE